MPQRIGLVLAGGEGRRLGGRKAELSLGALNLAQRAARALMPLCSTVLVSVGPGQANPAPRFDAVEDAPPAGRGPLAGLAAAFAATGRADLLVLACDYPGVETPLLARLAEAATGEEDLVLPTDPAGRDHPLVAFWRRSAQATVCEAVAAGRFKVRGLLAELRVRRLGPAELAGFDLDRQLANLNRAEDWEAWLAAARKPS